MESGRSGEGRMATILPDLRLAVPSLLASALQPQRDGSQ
jgi:hypothetical protein